MSVLYKVVWTPIIQEELHTTFVQEDGNEYRSTMITLALTKAGSIITVGHQTEVQTYTHNCRPVNCWSDKLSEHKHSIDEPPYSSAMGMEV